MFVNQPASRSDGLEACHHHAAGDEQIYRVTRNAGHLYIRTVYVGQETDTESLGRATKSGPTDWNQIHHPLIPSCTTSSSRGLLSGQSGPSPTPKDSPDLVPNLNGDRRHSLFPDVPLNGFVNEGNCVPSEGGVVISLAQKVNVEDGGKQRVLEGDGTQEDSGHDQELSVCYGLHRSVIVSWENERSL